MLLLAIFVDVKKSRKEQEEFLAEERAAKERRASVVNEKRVREERTGISSIDGSNGEKTDLKV